MAGRSVFQRLLYYFGIAMLVRNQEVREFVVNGFAAFTSQTPDQETFFSPFDLQMRFLVPYLFKMPPQTGQATVSTQVKKNIFAALLNSSLYSATLIMVFGWAKAV
jgi:hypothetical protein